MLKKSSNKTIGYRVKTAREAKRWTQAELASALELNDRQSISDIENGKRSVKPDELVLLSEVLSKDIEFFLDPFCIEGEAQFSWRASPAIDEENLNNFEIKAGKWIGLLRWLREGELNASASLKHSLHLTKNSSYENAIACAERLARVFELGAIPATKLLDFIENKLDIPVLFVDTIETPKGNSISGATCHLQDLGIILVNRNESEARCYFDLAHELFHVLTWDAIKPDHRESNSYEDREHGKKIEQLADNFAAALLMPKDSLETLIDKSRLDKVKYLLDISLKLCVSPTALAWRLFNLKWIDEYMLNNLKDERQCSSFSPKPFSKNFIELLYSAIEHGRLSARKAAKAMSMNLTQLKELFVDYSLPIPFEL